MNKLLIRRCSAGQKIDYSLYENQYLTTEALESGNISFTIPSGVTTGYVTSISYRKNGGNWVTTNNSSSVVTITVPVVAGDIIEWKGIVPTNLYYNGSNKSKFVANEASFNLYGNFMSLYWGDDFIGKTQVPYLVNNNLNYVPTGIGYSLFEGTKVIDASNFILPIINLNGQTETNGHHYACMFKNCTSLIYPPTTLPATIIGAYTYYQMFMGCTSMTTMPDMESIQDTTAAARASYSSMFSGCTALQYNTQQTIHINRGVYQGCAQMFYGCTSIVNAPNIEVYEFGNPVSGNGTSMAFDKMFYECTSLKTPPERFDLTEVDNGTFYQTFVNCTSLEYAPIINIRGLHFVNSTLTPNSGRYAFHDTFNGCTSLVDASGINIYFSDDSEWDGERTFANMFEGCKELIHGPSLNINGTVVNKSSRTIYNLCYNCQNMETHDIELNYVIDSNTSITTGSSWGSANMFLYCYKLKTSPRITRLALRDYELYQAFHSCWQLRDVYVKINTNTPGNGINSWMNDAGRDVASGITKTIHQAGTLSLPTNSNSGCPSGWTVNTADWTAQRHARMTIWVDDYPYDSDILDHDYGYPILVEQLNEETPERLGANRFDYFGDTITIDGTLYFVWVGVQTRESNASMYKLLTTTDNFYELYHESLEYWDEEYGHPEREPNETAMIEVINKPFSSLARILQNDATYGGNETSMQEWISNNRLVKIYRNQG